MWNYESVTREQFESVKDRVEELLIECGAEKTDIKVPYEQKTTSYSGDNTIEHISHRASFKFGDDYYRVDEVCFSKKPSIVLECGSYDELMKNIMEDMDPFPYDLSEQDLCLEVQVALRLKDYYSGE